jgi:hypothetical protein
MRVCKKNPIPCKISRVGASGGGNGPFVCANLMNGEHFVNCDTSAYMNRDFNYFGVVSISQHYMAGGYLRCLQMFE